MGMNLLNLHCNLLKCKFVVPIQGDGVCREECGCRMPHRLELERALLPASLLLRNAEERVRGWLCWSQVTDYCSGSFGSNAVRKGRTAFSVIHSPHFQRLRESWLSMKSQIFRPPSSLVHQLGTKHIKTLAAHTYVRLYMWASESLICTSYYTSTLIVRSSTFPNRLHNLPSPIDHWEWADNTVNFVWRDA